MLLEVALNPDVVSFADGCSLPPSKVVSLIHGGITNYIYIFIYIYISIYIYIYIYI